MTRFFTVRRGTLVGGTLDAPTEPLPSIITPDSNPERTEEELENNLLLLPGRPPLLRDGGPRENEWEREERRKFKPYKVHVPDRRWSAPPWDPYSRKKALQSTYRSEYNVESEFQDAGDGPPKDYMKGLTETTPSELKSIQRKAAIYRTAAHDALRAEDEIRGFKISHGHVKDWDKAPQSWTKSDYLKLVAKHEALKEKEKAAGRAFDLAISTLQDRPAGVVGVDDVLDNNMSNALGKVSSIPGMRDEIKSYFSTFAK